MGGLSPILADHFRAPRCVGRVERPTGAGRSENPGCGDRLEVTVRLEGDVVAEARFLCQGCSAAIGAASYLMERAAGRRVGEILSWDTDGLLADLGETAAVRRHAVRLAERALREAIGAARGRG